MPSDDLAEVLYSLTKNYMPNCCLAIERNGGFGTSVIQRLVKTDIKKNLYYEIKEKVIEESFNGYRVNKNKARVRVYGIDSTKSVRARLIEILYDRVAYHKDKFIAKILLDEMGSMEVKPSGKVEHSSTSHDDQVFSYLMALYVWYDGKNVMENFNIQKNVIKTDEDEEIVEGELEQDTSMERVPMEEINMDDDSSELDDQLDYIKEASKYKLGYMFNNELYMREQQARDLLLATNKVARQAYNEKYNVSESETGVVKTVMLPDTIFMDDEQMLLSGKVDNGNMFDIFNGL